MIFLGDCLYQFSGFKGSKPRSFAYVSKNFFLYPAYRHGSAKTKQKDKIREVASGEAGEEFTYVREPRSDEANGGKEIKEACVILRL